MAGDGEGGREVEQAPPAPGESPRARRDYRARLTRGKDVVDPEAWAGAIPVATGIAPRLRVGANRWFNVLWLAPIGFVVGVLAIAAAKGLREMPSVEAFIRRHPGTSSVASVAGSMPAWLCWQHFLNLFFMVFIIRAGVQILADHPRLYWTRHSTPGKEWLRMQKPVPADPLWTAKQDSLTLPRHIGLPGLRHTIGLARWWHLGVDVLWVANGLVFYVLLFTSDEWRRIVPTSWEVFPDALSVLVQYLSLHWPPEGPAGAYNALQVLAYFITVFVAAPLALITGLGMSPALSTRFKRVSKLLSIQVARSTHFLVLCWFSCFIVGHVALVFSTGLVRNVDAMFAGVVLFVVAMVVVIAAWLWASPFTLRHPRVVQRAGFALIGPVQRWFEHVDARPGQYQEADISTYFWHNGAYPESDEYRALFEGGFADYRLHIHGLVDNPVELSLAELRALPHHAQITQHFCIQGWSGIAKWGGVSMGTILELVRPKPEAKWVVFYSLGDGPDKGLYYDAHPIEQMHYELTMLAYDMNDAPLTYGHGAPLRLRNEVQLGFKQVKWLAGIEFVASYADIGGGHGGYNEDHEFFGYRQSI